MSKPSQVIVLLEDANHQMLVYRYLKMHGLGHETRIKPPASGVGSAESWVRNNFAKEVSAYRLRQRRVKTALIVVIDADNHSVQDRWKQLDQVLKDAQKPPVDVQFEKIARLVPKRNIETWILCLNMQMVNELTDYKTTRNDWNELIPPAAETLFQWSHQVQELPNQCVGSLRTGIKELSRLAL
jgi:hypothetical protein